MSTRALRRMQAAAASSAREKDDADDAAEDEDDGEVEEIGGAVGNKFDILLPEDENSDKDDDGEDAESNQAKSGTSNKKRKKKKSKKQQPSTSKQEAPAIVDDDDLFLQQAVAQAEAAAAATAAAEKCNDYFDDAVVRNADGASSQRQSLCSKLGITVKDPLSLHSKYLNAAHEVRYRFGPQAAGGSATAQLRGAHRNGQRRSALNSRLITPRPNWPLLGRTGLSMRQLDASSNNNAGIPTFTFEHDNTYAAIQQEFWTAVESLSPDAIAAVHRRHPYHIDTLLQLAELCLTADDPQSAGDLVERTVYAMETSLHHNFILSRVGSRVLDFRYFESRSFYLAIFRHIILLGRKGCTRTAFELSKMLLSLDFRRDPMCALLFMDFYALRANCYPELIAIYDALCRDKSLDWLPNFAYSVPLALFRLSGSSSSGSSSLSSSSRSSHASPDAILAQAKSLMFEALTRFPSVLIPLLESCSVKPDGRLASCKWFVASQADAKEEPNGLKALQSLYVTRCGTVWKDMETLRWLESVVAQFVETMPNEEVSRRATRERALAAFRQPCGRNILRHLILSGHREPIGFVSSEVPFTAAIFSYDPLPPNDAIMTYTRTNPRGGRSTEASSPLDLFASFFASLLPNFNPAEQNQVQLRFDNFIRAFRDVIAGLHLEAPPLDQPQQQQQQGNEQQQQERFDLADLTDSSDNEANQANHGHDELD